MCGGRRMLAEITAVLAEILQHCFGVKSPHCQYLEQRRRAMALAEDKTVPLRVGGSRRINLEHMKIECGQNINARETRAEMRCSGSMRSFDNSHPQRPCNTIELLQVLFHT